MNLVKDIGYYLIFLILITFICSLLNIIGLNSTVTNLILFIFNIASFITLGFKNGIKSKERGFVTGLKISGILLLILIITNIILIHNLFTLPTIIYYIILLLSGTFGGMLGKAKKKEED